VFCECDVGKICNLLWNVHQYYRQFEPNVDKFISDARETSSDAVKVLSLLHDTVFYVSLCFRIKLSVLLICLLLIPVCF